MIHSPFSSTLIWATTGQTLSWLHLLPLWVILVVLVLQIWSVATAALKRSSTKLMTPLMTMRNALLRWRQSRRRGEGFKITRGTTSYGPILFCFMLITAACIVATVYAAYRPPVYVQMHDVWVDSRTGPYTFAAWVRDPATGEWNRFIVNGCPDFEPTREIQAGVTLKLLQYVEDRSNSCDELDGKYAGYILLRDAHDNPILSTIPGPSTTSQSSRPAGSEEALP